MVEAVLWMVGGALLTIAALVCYAACVGLMADDDKYRRDTKHNNHHKWTGR